MTVNSHITQTTRRFYKEKGIWYIDLPEFLEAGLGTKANLMMVGGADTFLDKLSNNTNETTIKFSDFPFDEHTDTLFKMGSGYDADYLREVGHAEVDGGAYYHADKAKHDLWLCPVTRYVFGGEYPLEIFIQKIK